MRIMQIITLAELGGAQNVVCELVGRALSEGHEVILVANGKGSLWDKVPPSPSLKRYPLPSLMTPISPLKDLKTLFAFWKIALKEKPDIIHLHSAKAGFLGRIAFAFMRKRIIYTQHGFDSIIKGHPKTLPIEKLADRLCYAQIAVSEYDKKLIDSVGIKGGMRGTQVIHNGTQEIGIRADLEHMALFTRLRESGKTIILSMARFKTDLDREGQYPSNQQKNFPLSMEVARELGDDYHLIWMGNSGETPQDLPANVTLLGLVSDAKYYLPLADLSLLLSHYEGFPMSILESFSVGTPVFASDVGGVSEAIEDGVTGLLDSSNNPVLIATKIKGAFASPQCIENMGKVAQEKWAKGFTTDKMWEKYLSLWEEMI